MKKTVNSHHAYAAIEAPELALSRSHAPYPTPETHSHMCECRLVKPTQYRASFLLSNARLFILHVGLRRHGFFMAVPIEGCWGGEHSAASVIASSDTLLLHMGSCNKCRSGYPTLVNLPLPAMSSRTRLCKPLTGTLPTA